MDKSILKSTGVVAFFTLLSRIMGLIRDIVISSVFGANALVDGFYVAFRIPNLFRRFVAEGCLTISFVPVYTEYLMTKERSEALELAQKTLSALSVFVFLIVSLGMIFSPEIVRLFGYGFTNAEQISLTIGLNRLMFPYLFLISLVSFAMGYLNSHKYFFGPSFSPVLFNVGNIFGALFLSRFFDKPLYGLAIGILLGGVMQLILQIPYMIRAGFKMKFSLDLNHPGIRKIFKMMAPALFGIAIYQINIIMSTMLASTLPGGSISWLFYSDRLTEVVLGVFVVSLGNVLLPELSGFAAAGDMSKIRDLYLSSVKAVLLISIPAAIALMYAGLPIISVLFKRGNFSFYDVDMTYKALFYASIGIPSISILRITVPAYYSLKDTKTPVYTSLLSFFVNIGSGFFLMQTALKHGGLTLGLSIASTVQMLILVYILQKKIGHIGFGQFMLPVLKFVLAGIVMAVSISLIAGFVDWANDPFVKRMIFLVIIVITGIAVYFVTCFLLRVHEVVTIKNLAVKLFKKFS
ncbi:MAG: murein biosynthesis integral membrane protein MurJ [Spirochaetota bacterium]